ncbi:MAG: hypothetical protein GY759_09235 [Chloroflexi bacterium]|nr:hypothetical protein [Chloroflexota bacterium]
MSEHKSIDSQLTDANDSPYDGGEFELNRVFVVMPFREDMNSEYQAIRETCEGLGLRLHRVDENVASGNILKEITHYIKRAEFIIFDLSHESPNVYYELGYAHGVGNEAFDFLLIAKEGTKLQFDISPLRVNYYQNIDDLRTIIASNLINMIQMTR